MKNSVSARELVMLGVLGVSVLLAGCGSGFPATPVAEPTSTATVEPTAEPTEEPTKEPTATAVAQRVEPRPVAEDWELYTLDEEGIALSLPPSWQVFDLDKEAMTENIRGLWQANPEIAETMTEQMTNMAVQGGIFFAFDMESPTLLRGVPSSVNIMRKDKVGSNNLDTFLAFTIAGLKQIYGEVLEGDVRSTRVKAASGHTMGRMAYVVNLTAPDGSPLPMSMVQFLALEHGDMFIISCGWLNDGQSDYTDTCDQIGQGVYLLK